MASQRSSAGWKICGERIAHWWRGILAEVLGTLASEVIFHSVTSGNVGYSFVCTGRFRGQESWCGSLLQQQEQCFFAIVQLSALLLQRKRRRWEAQLSHERKLNHVYSNLNLSDADDIQIRSLTQSTSLYVYDLLTLSLRFSWRHYSQVGYKTHKLINAQDQWKHIHYCRIL